MMERYFEQTDFTTDARPDLSYQVGVTPELTEQPRNHCQRAAQLEADDQPVTLCPPELDKKSRFFWRIGDRPEVKFVFYSTLTAQHNPSSCCRIRNLKN